MHPKQKRWQKSAAVLGRLLTEPEVNLFYLHVRTCFDLFGPIDVHASVAGTNKGRGQVD
jgi:hypothetical protein